MDFAGAGPIGILSFGYMDDSEQENGGYGIGYIHGHNRVEAKILGLKLEKVETHHAEKQRPGLFLIKALSCEALDEGFFIGEIPQA